MHYIVYYKQGQKSRNLMHVVPSFARFNLEFNLGKMSTLFENVLCDRFLR